MTHGFDLSSPLVCEGIIGDGCGGGRIFFVNQETLFVYDPTTKQRRELLKAVKNVKKISKKACIIILECENDSIHFDLSSLKS